MSSTSTGPEASAGALSKCNPELKLGDTCDSCWKGIMLPPGGVSYYDGELKKYGPLRSPKTQKKIICERCGHWHNSLGQDFSSGFDNPKE